MVEVAEVTHEAMELCRRSNADDKISHLSRKVAA